MLHHEQNDDANEDATDDRVGEELCPECQGSMKDSTCAACGYVQEASVAAAFDESKHPRRPKGDKGGGQFTVKENAAGRFEVVDQDTGKKVAETTDASDAQVVADEKNAAGGVVVTPSLVAEQQDYQNVLDQARTLGIPTSLDDPSSPPTVDALRERIQQTLGVNQTDYTEVAPGVFLARDGSHSVSIDPNSPTGSRRDTLNLNDSSAPPFEAVAVGPGDYSVLNQDTGEEIGRVRTAQEAVAMQDAENELYFRRERGLTSSAALEDTPAKVVLDECDECQQFAEAVTAAIPVAPPDEWFQDPNLDGPTPITITDDGRIFGHAANWGTCHIGYPRGPGRCVPPPRSRTGYSKFHLGGVQTASGQLLPIGNITLDTGHAPLMRGGRTVDARTAAAHYDDTGTVVADVRAGEDEHGIWFAGALRPDVTASVVRKLLGAKISGDWRGGELVGMLGVNVPGFPVPRADGILADAGDDTLALVAACIVDDPQPSPVPPMIAAEVLAARAEGADPIAVLERIAVTGR